MCTLVQPTMQKNTKTNKIVENASYHLMQFVGKRGERLGLLEPLKKKKKKSPENIRGVKARCDGHFHPFQSP